MGQAHLQPGAMFPLTSILQRVNGLAHFPPLEDAETFLDGIMHDPIIRRLMTTEHLMEDDVRHAIERTRPHLLRH
ncbi:MAG: hypothetical protein HQ504_06840 [Rhodospirillaceae bacterium]|nr:hypothetical protein [Rhodospirillaceae bacterium]